MGSKKLVMKFPFRYQDEYSSQMCLYKLCFNDHFFVAGCKRLKKRVLQHSEEIERKLRLGLKKDDIYEKVINYIRETGCSEFVVELIFPIALESEIPMYEQRVFNLVNGNPLCLNTDLHAHKRTYHQKKAEAPPIRLEPKPAPDPKPKRQPKKQPVPPDWKSVVNVEVEAPPMEIKSNVPAPVNSFQEALKRINESYAKDRN